MIPHRGIGVYRALLRCYPRHFRDEYGSDMVLLFGDQLRDEPALRVWGRGFVDLAISVPTRHLEAHMDRPPTSFVPLLFAAGSLAGAVVAIIGGSNPAIVAAGLSVAAVTGLVALTSWRRTRGVAVAGSPTAQWWKLLAAGAGTLLAMIVAEGATDVSLWVPMMIAVLFALVLVAAGLVLGVAHLVTTHSRAPG